MQIIIRHSSASCLDLDALRKVLHCLVYTTFIVNVFFFFRFVFFFRYVLLQRPTLVFNRLFAVDRSFFISNMWIRISSFNFFSIQFSASFCNGLVLQAKLFLDLMRDLGSCFLNIKCRLLVCDVQSMTESLLIY